MEYRLILGVAFLFLGQFPLANGILGGTFVLPSAAPALVQLRYFEDAYNQCEVCGGMLLDPYNVLTVAHCVFKFTLSTDPFARIEIWRQQLDNPAPNHSVLNYYRLDTIHAKDRVHIHPDYLRFPKMDAAIINLTGYVTSSHYTELEDDPNRDFGLADVDLYGYGRYEIHRVEYSDRLRTATFPLALPHHCQPLAPRSFRADVHLCLRAINGQSHCMGDSGGPIMYDGRQIAIITTRYEECLQGYSWHVKVAPILPWIKRKSFLPVNKKNKPPSQLPGLLADAYCTLRLDVDPTRFAENVWKLWDLVKLIGKVRNLTKISDLYVELYRVARTVITIIIGRLMNLFYAKLF